MGNKKTTTIHMATILNIMTKKVICVHPETPLIEATNLLIKEHLNGLPVVDTNQTLVGIITEFDLIIKGSSVHLPTLIKLLSQFDLYKKDKRLIKDDLKKIFDMKVKDVMNHDPLTLPDTASIEDVARSFSEHHRVNPIPIIDKENKVAGIISRYDLNKFFGTSSAFFLNGESIKSRDIDKNVNSFLDNFERQFTFVSKTRTRLWLLASILFAMVGYFIAWAMILRFD